MIKSISQWAFDPQRPLDEVFALAREHRFDAVELTVDETGPLPLDIQRDECRRIVDSAEKAGVGLASLASGLGWKYPITSPDPAVRKQGEEAIARSLEIAGWLGLDALLVVPGGVAADFIDGFPITPYDDAFERATRAAAALAPIARDCGVVLAIENVWNMFLLSPLELRDFIDAAGSPYVGSYFDVGNVVATGYPEQWVRILGKRIKRVHLKDFKRSVATLDGFCPLLEGDVNYPAVMKSLREAGYDGPLTAEFFGVEDQLAGISSAIDQILNM